MLDEALREIVREELREALQELPRPVVDPAEGAEESWRSRIWRVHDDTRLQIAEVAQVLGRSERTVRRHLNGETEAPDLAYRDGPGGVTVRAEDLRCWIRDVEEGRRFAESGGSR